MKLQVTFFSSAVFVNRLHRQNNCYSLSMENYNFDSVLPTFKRPKDPYYSKKVNKFYNGGFGVKFQGWFAFYE